MVITKQRKRDIRTRVPQAVYVRVATFASSKNISNYQAAERLILLGLASTESAPEEKLFAATESLSARLDEVLKLVDRSAFGAFVSYAYARAAALGQLTGEARDIQDKKLLQIGSEAFNNQINKAFE